MIRSCDGLDPNLVRECEPGDPNESPIWKGFRPCDCGQVFDDVNRSTVYPHKEI